MSSKKTLRPAEKRELVSFIHEEHGISISKACTALRQARTVFIYQSSPWDNLLVITVLFELVEAYPRYGFPKYFASLRRRGHLWNHKRVHRIYREPNLHLRRKGKKRLPPRCLVRLETQSAASLCWSVDFMSDSLMSRQRFRAFNVLDDFSREILVLEVNTNLPSARVICVLERIAAWRGYPAKLRMDNGPDLFLCSLQAGRSNTRRTGIYSTG